MAYENSPSSIMYAELKALGVSNRDAAMVLLDTGLVLGGATLQDRIDSRTRLSRDIVHVAPGSMSQACFKDFEQSVQALLGRMVARLRGQYGQEATSYLAQQLSSESAEAMLEALRAYNIDGNVYRNGLSRIAGLDVASDGDRALLYLLLLVVTGCTGDPLRGVQAVEDFSASRLGTAFRTTEVHVDLEVEEPDDGDDYALGLMRIVGGKLKGPDAFYRLAADERGTEIGTMASGAGAIADVDADVSRRHARVYKRGGHWYIVGLKSTNGTTVISGADKLEHVVEPPRRDRPRTWEPEPFEVFPTDTICLGASTRFMVMPILG